MRPYFEEWLSLDVFSISLTSSQPPVWVSPQQLQATQSLTTLFQHINHCTFLMTEIASDERNRGQRTSSFTILSNTSSSSSPGKGLQKSNEETHDERDKSKLKKFTSPTNISYMSTPSPHQSTALVQDTSVSTYSDSKSIDWYVELILYIMI